MSEPTPQRHRYGPDPSQFADLRTPSRRRPGTVVLIHGGFWGPRFGNDHLDKVAADLARRGWVTWNVEYRRLGIGGGYPSTLQDVAAAIDYLATLADVDTDCVVAVGHSAGGQLATWAAGRAKLPSAAARQKIGNGAAAKLMGGDPGEFPDRYAVADPLAQVPIPAAVRCIHARADDRVPFEESARYVTAARAAGQDARLIEVVGDHFSVADPSAPTSPIFIAELQELPQNDRPAHQDGDR
jgi:acetyl esterase/lipase